MAGDASPALAAEALCRRGRCGRRRGRPARRLSPRRVLGCDHEGGPSTDGDRVLRREAAPWRAVHARQPGGCSADRGRLISLRTAGPGPGTASVAGVIVGDPGRLQLDHSPGGVVHLRYRQAQPVSQAWEPFAAGPGDRLLQLRPADEIGRARGGARHGGRIWCGQVARALMIWCRRIPVHCGLLGGVAGLGRAACPVSEAVSSAGLGSRLASLSRAAEVSTTHDRPQERPQESARPANTGDGCATSARALADCSWRFRLRFR
jgi:hypothetical protein